MNAEAKDVAQTTAATPAKEKAKKEVETVTMEDGRKVEFAGKRQLLKDYLIDEAAGTVTARLDFRNGQTVLWLVPKELLLQTAGHGAIQKLGDQTAGYKEDEIDDAVLDVMSLVERLDKGEWNVKREGGGFAGTSILMRALMELRGKTQEEIKAFLENKTQPEKMALRAHPKVKPIVDRLEAEKLAKGTKIDTDALLEAL